MNKILLSMVASVNKWLKISTLSLFTVFTIGTGIPGGEIGPTSKKLHPFHVSTTEINYNAADKTLEINCRIFLDDFESCLSKLYNTKADLTSAAVKAGMDSLVKKYLVSHLLIKADGKAGIMKYVGFEKQDESVYTYFEVDNISTVKKIDVTDNILHDLYDDQMSIIHVIVNGNRKSMKLDFPDKEASFSF